jgi:hypothetical protein
MEIFIRLLRFCADAVMLAPDLVADLVEQFWGKLVQAV